MKRDISKKKSSSSWKALIITFAVIGTILLGGGLIYFFTKNKNKSSQQTNLGAQQNQQTQSAVLQLANSLLDDNNNLNQLTKKPDGTAKTIQEIEEEFLISSFNSKQPNVGMSQTLPPEVIERTWWELRPWIEEYLQDLNKSILEHAKEKFRRDVENWLKWQQKEYNRQLEEYRKRLQELKKIEDLIAEYQKIREQELLDKISRKTELRNKGYVDRDIEKLKEWNLLDQEIPDLTAEKRIGATNILWTSERGYGKIGGSSDLIIFLKPKVERIPQVKSNRNNSETIINFSTQIAHKDKEGYKQFVRDYLTENGKLDYDAYCLIRTDSSMSGASAGIAYYLALYSLINKVPLPRNLGSTGTVFKRPKVGLIGGLDLKLEYNVKKEKPINIFILSIENKKDDYPSQSWEDIASYIKNHVKQVHFVSSVKEIEIALNEILNNTIKDQVCVCGNKERKPNEPRGPPEKPQQPNFEITAEKLLAFMFDHGFCRVSRNKENKQGNAIPPASAEIGPLQNILSIEFGKSGAFEKVRNLYDEYKQKLNSDSDIDEWYKNELAKLENQNNSEENQEKVSEIQEEIDELKKEAETKRKAAEQSHNNQAKIIELEKEIEGYKQAKANEEIILENINRQIEENQQNSNQNPNQNFEAQKQEVSKRIDELNEKIAASEAEITNLRQNQPNEELIKEAEELETQIRHLEKELQKLLLEQKTAQSPSSRELEIKRSQLEQEYRMKKSNDHGSEQLFQEYERKFREIATPLANLIPNISQQLADLGYKKIIINWKQGEQFGRIHLTTTEPSVNFEVVKN